LFDVLLKPVDNYRLVNKNTRVFDVCCILYNYASTNIVVDEAVVQPKIDKLRPDKAAGSDELSPRILSQPKEVICYPVTMIMRASIESGVVPDD